MKISINLLSDKALDWAVAKCEGWSGWNGESFDYKGSYVYYPVSLNSYCPSSDWSVAGPIIEREEINIQSTGDVAKWRSCVWDQKTENFSPYRYGETPLIAAMRCYVSFKLGNTIEVPDELTESN